MGLEGTVNIGGDCILLVLVAMLLLSGILGELWMSVYFRGSTENTIVNIANQECLSRQCHILHY